MQKICHYRFHMLPPRAGMEACRHLDARSSADALLTFAHPVQVTMCFKFFTCGILGSSRFRQRATTELQELPAEKPAVQHVQQHNGHPKGDTTSPENSITTCKVLAGRICASCSSITPSTIHVGTTLQFNAAPLPGVSGCNLCDFFRTLYADHKARLSRNKAEPFNTTLHMTTQIHSIQVKILEIEMKDTLERRHRHDSVVAQITIADTWYGNELKAVRVYFRDLRPEAECPLEVHAGIETWSGERAHGVTSKWADLALARRWVGECIENHPDCASISSAGTTAVTLLQQLHPTTKFIDVRLNRLVQLGEVYTRTAVEYIALSYVWGKEYQLLTTSLSLEVFKRRLPTDVDASGRLPRTIEDAMLVTRSLGYRFLWVDALCIVQDSPRDLEVQLAQMDLIYGLAATTIVARGSSSSDGGLLGVSSPRSPTLGVHSEVLVNCGLSIGRWDVLSSHEEYEEDHGTYADPKFYVWRGWTFQEQILSTRCLEFCAQRMLFWCGRRASRQDSGYPGAATTDMRNPHHFRHAVRQYQRTQAGINLNERDNMTLPMLTSRWFTIRETYSRRSFSFMTDRRRAIMGTARALNGVMGGIDSGGHFRNNFHVELLWSLDTNSHKSPASLVTFTCNPAPEGLFPSWSWLSLWPISWPALGEPLPGVDVRIRGDDEFANDSVLEIEGSVLELRVINVSDGAQKLVYLDGSLANIDIHLDSSLEAGTILCCIPLARAISMMWWEQHMLLLQYVGPRYIRAGVGVMPEHNSDVFIQHLKSEAQHKLIECC